MPVLRGKKPNEIEHRLKMLMYGPPTSGKTTAAIGFPNCFEIDCEKGCERESYVRLLAQNQGALFQTADFDEVVQEVTTLLTTKHPYKTLCIDPASTIYADLCDKSALACAATSARKGDLNSDGTEFGRHKLPADRKFKRLLNLLLRIDMNVIVTAHAKDKWEGAGEIRKQTGVTFDCYGKLDYLFDLVLELQKRGKERWAVVRKTRMEQFPEGDQFPFSYQEIAKRCDIKVLEREAHVENLATIEQVAECQRLIAALKFDEETVQKWLDKATCATLAEMPTETIAKCVDFLKRKITDPQPKETA